MGQRIGQAAYFAIDLALIVLALGALFQRAAQRIARMVQRLFGGFGQRAVQCQRHDPQPCLRFGNACRACVDAQQGRGGDQVQIQPALAGQAGAVARALCQRVDIGRRLRRALVTQGDTPAQLDDGARQPVMEYARGQDDVGRRAGAGLAGDVPRDQRRVHAHAGERVGRQIRPHGADRILRRAGAAEG